MTNIEFFCYNCKKVFPDYKDLCFCGGVYTRMAAPKGHIKSNTAYSLRNEPKVKKSILEPFDFLGEIPKDFAIMLWGIAGHGKSTLALLMAQKIAQKYSNKYCAYWSYEEKTKESFKTKLEDLLIDRPNIIAYDSNTLYETLDLCKRDKPTTLIIDSISEAKIKVKDLRPLEERGPNYMPRRIYICHATKNGKYKGGTEIAHKVDIEITVKNGIARTKKNRYSEKGKTFNVFEYANELRLKSNLQPIGARSIK